MSSEPKKFAHRSKPWSELARRDELRSVLYCDRPERVNHLMHGSTLVAARLMASLSRKRGVLLDFGCGTGRMIRHFGTRGWSVIGTDITEGMLERAREFGLPTGCQLYLTDGVSIPLANQSVDMIWVCGVLKYTLFDPSSRCRGGAEPDKIASKASHRKSDTTSVETFSAVYSDVAKEMYRVLKPGGFVINVEMWVEAEPDVFISDFENSGFVNKRVGVLRRYLGMPERIGEWREWHPLPKKIVVTAGLLIAQFRLWFDSPRRKCEGMRDYLFVWSKPKD